MHLRSLHIRNYRSIVDSSGIRIERLQAFVGENNAGKSNVLRALQVFLTAGAGGVRESDFFDTAQPIVIKATFTNLHPGERKRLRKYLLGTDLILEKHIALAGEDQGEKKKVSAQYHGYLARPKDWWLSVDGVLGHEDSTRPNWKRVSEDHGIYDYVKKPDGKVDKASYERGINQYIEEHEEIEFEEPTLGETQALGLQPALLEALPAFHLLPAITDYTDEIDKRSSSTSFRRLMGDLGERLLRADPRYAAIETSLQSLSNLLNPPATGETRPEDQARLAVLEQVETAIKGLVSKLMPSVDGVELKVTIDPIQQVFSQGVQVWVDDGRLTEVMQKGHGLQRCIVFSLIQAFILNQRGQLVASAEGPNEQLKAKPIILAIEEPELYIHPQMQRLVYGVLSEFAGNDQVLYSTHAPAFVDLGCYENVAVVRKHSPNEGTTVSQCEEGVLGDPEERKWFQFLTHFGLEKNAVFFAQTAVLVEGEQDLIAVLATARHLGLFKECPEEIGYTVISVDGKHDIPKYQRILKAFKIPYVLLHELDGEPESDINKNVSALLGDNRSAEIQTRLEDACGHPGHFRKCYDVKKFFENPKNIAEPFKKSVRELFAVE